MSKVQLLDLFEEKLEIFYDFNNEFYLKKVSIEGFDFENFDKYSYNVQNIHGSLKTVNYVQHCCEKNGVSGDFEFMIKTCVEQKVIEPYLVSLLAKDKFIKINNVQYRILIGNPILGPQDFYIKNGKEDKAIKIMPEYYNYSLKQVKDLLHLRNECGVDYFLRKVKVLQND